MYKTRNLIKNQNSIFLKFYFAGNVNFYSENVQKTQMNLKNMIQDFVYKKNSKI